MSCLLSTRRKVQGFVVPGLAFQCARTPPSFMKALGRPAVMVALHQLVQVAALPRCSDDQHFHDIYKASTGETYKAHLFRRRHRQISSPFQRILAKEWLI